MVPQPSERRSLAVGEAGEHADDQQGGDQAAAAVADEMASALSSQLGQTTTKLLEKNLNIKPTLEIRPGYQFNIIVTKDMVMKAPYVPLR